MVDCVAEEELCSMCQVSIAVDKDGHVLSTHMEGAGAVPYKEVKSIVQVRWALIRVILTPFIYVDCSGSG